MTAQLAVVPPSATDDTRIPPADLDAEAAVLSACFVADATPELEPEHFYSDANRLIYQAIRATRADGPVDVVLVASHLRAAGQLGRIGGAVYLAQVIDATPAAANVGAHAALVRECWRRRVLIAAFQQCEAELYAGSLSAGEAWRRMKECCDV